jgi:hypothetical protein
MCTLLYPKAGLKDNTRQDILDDGQDACTTRVDPWSSPADFVWDKCIALFKSTYLLDHLFEASRVGVRDINHEACFVKGTLFIVGNEVDSLDIL